MFATGMRQDGDSRGAHYLPSVTVQKHILIIISSMQQNWSPVKVWCFPTKTKASRNGTPTPPTWTCCNSRLLVGSLQVKMSKWTRVKKAERRLMVEVCDALKSLWPSFLSVSWKYHWNVEWCTHLLHHTVHRKKWDHFCLFFVFSQGSNKGEGSPLVGLRALVFN